MAFTVEDGTGTDPLANAYISVAEMQAYFADRSPLDPGVLSSDLELAIVRATDYIELEYGNQFLGDLLVTDQALCWPRTYDLDNPMPAALKNATSEFANSSLTSDLFFVPTYDASGKTVKRQFDKVGPIETETEWSDGGSTDFTRKRYPIAERWMKIITFGGSGGVVR
tara:strand:+ start:9188 stop:9691 length:504 start_codon:yes stop_codon:yes gene_type:complete